jgi:hypothetical protein
MSNLVDQLFTKVSDVSQRLDTLTIAVDALLSRVLRQETAEAWCVRTQYSCGSCGVHWRLYKELCCGWLGCYTHYGCSYC